MSRDYLRANKYGEVVGLIKRGNGVGRDEALARAKGMPWWREGLRYDPLSSSRYYIFRGLSDER